MPERSSGDGLDLVAVPNPMNTRPPEESAILVVSHAELAIGPSKPSVVRARAAVKSIEPKLVSGSGSQKLVVVHAEGASAIQSAELVSTDLAVICFENDSCSVWSVSRRVTRCPKTTTLALMRSPGLTVIRMLFIGEGTSSYHAEDVMVPEALQSSSVPICSRASELEL